MNQIFTKLFNVLINYVDKFRFGDGNVCILAIDCWERNRLNNVVCVTDHQMTGIIGLNIEITIGDTARLQQMYDVPRVQKMMPTHCFLLTVILLFLVSTENNIQASFSVH